MAVLACRAEPPFAACSIGTVARILSFGRQPCCQRWVADLEGQARVRVDDWLGPEPFREARCTRLVNSVTDPSLHGLASAIHAEARRLHDLFPDCVHARRAVERLTKRGGPGHLPGAIGDLLLHLSVPERQRLLELEPLGARLEATLASLHARATRPSARERLH
ncbi:MAG: LON peptidase substrate-binding domain-containing protein [Polyangia bacterium]